MKKNEIIIGKKQDGTVELVAIEYESRGRVSKPTRESEILLANYESWKNLTSILKYNLDFQSEFQKIFRDLFL